MTDMRVETAAMLAAKYANPQASQQALESALRAALAEVAKAAREGKLVTLNLDLNREFYG